MRRLRNETVSSVRVTYRGRRRLDAVERDINVRGRRTNRVPVLRQAELDRRRRADRKAVRHVVRAVDVKIVVRRRCALTRMERVLHQVQDVQHTVGLRVVGGAARHGHVHPRGAFRYVVKRARNRTGDHGLDQARLGGWQNLQGSMVRMAGCVWTQMATSGLTTVTGIRKTGPRLGFSRSYAITSP